jgi:hypothetical protein
MDKSDAKSIYKSLIFISLQAKSLMNKKFAFIAVVKSRKKTDIFVENSDTNVMVAVVCSRPGSL